MTNPIDSLTNRTPIRLSIAQMVCLVGTIVSGTVGITITVIGSLHEVRDSVRDVRSVADMHTRQLAEITRQIEDIKTAGNARDIATNTRLQEWTSWRWTVNADIHTLGRATGADIWTKGNP